MKILFIAALSNPSASGRQRIWALEQCGIEVITINKDDFTKSDLLHKIIYKLKWPLLLKSKSLTRKVTLTSRFVKPDYIWIEWSKEFSLNDIQKFKSSPSKPKIISFQDDNPWGNRLNEQWSWANYYKTIPYFDFHIVKRKTDFENIQRLSGMNIKMWKHGIYQPLFRPQVVKNSYKYPISFVGTCMDGREDFIKYLLEKSIPIHVFGNQWQEKSKIAKTFPEHFHPAVEGQAYVDVIWASQLCLGFVSESNKDEWTMRTYEVPGCRKILLAPKTPEHEELFGNLSNYVLFENQDDCVRKIKYLLDNIELRTDLENQIFELFNKMQRNLNQRMRDLITDLEMNFNNN
jgi:hypothetical protein